MEGYIQNIDVNIFHKNAFVIYLYLTPQSLIRKCRKTPSYTIKHTQKIICIYMAVTTTTCLSPPLRNHTHALAAPPPTSPSLPYIPIHKPIIESSARASTSDLVHLADRGAELLISRCGLCRISYWLRCTFAGVHFGLGLDQPRDSTYTPRMVFQYIYIYFLLNRPALVHIWYTKLEQKGTRANGL